MSTAKQANPERKYIRLQEIGLCLALSVPIILVAVAYIHGWTFYGAMATRMTMILILLVLGLCGTGFALVQYGDDKRRELKNAKMQQVWEERRPPGESP